jgi:flagellar hook-associated protein 1
MATLFGILDIGAKGIFAQQRALNTTGHNMANATTPGYSRQRVNFSSSFPLNTNPGPLGTGVQVDSIERFRDAFVDQQTRTQLSLLGFFNTAREGYDQLEVVLNQPLNPVANSLDNPNLTGLNEILSRLFGAFQELSLSPESGAARSSILETAVTATTTFNNIDSQLQQLRQDTNDQIELQVEDINLLINQVADINQQIAQIEIQQGNMANDARDKRDALVAELSRLVPVRTVENPNGSINLQILGVNVVSGNEVTTELEALATPGDPNNFVSVVFERERSRVLNDLFEGGELGALFNVRDTVVPDFQARIDELAQALIHEVNRIHAGGSGLEFYQTLTSLNSVTDALATLSGAGLDASIQSGQFTIVVEDANGIAQGTYDITVDPTVDTLTSLAAAIDAADGTPAGGILSATVVNNQLVIDAASGMTFHFEGDTSGVLGALGMNTFFSGDDAGSISLVQDVIDNPNHISHSGNGAPGNVDNAISLAQLDTALVLNNGTTTFADFDRSTLSLLGVQSRRMEELEINTDMLVTELKNRQEEVAGVSLDEEAVNLIRFQQAFTAAARFLTSIDEVIDLVVNRMGLVGR